MVVVPEGAHLLSRVAAGGDVRIVLVVEFPRPKEVHGVAVALGRRVAVVEMGGRLRPPEAPDRPLVEGRQIVVHADQGGRAVRREVGRAGVLVVVTPDRLHRQLGMEAVLGRPLVNFEARPRRVAQKPLVGDHAAFAGRHVGPDRGRGGEGRDRVHRSRAKIDGGVDGQRHREGSGRRAHRIVPRGGSVGGGSAGAETGLGDEHPARRHEAHLHHLPSAQLRRDECAPVLRGVFDRFQAGLRYVWCGGASRIHLLVPSSCVLRSTVPSIRWISGGRRVPCWESASAVTAPGGV